MEANELIKFKSVFFNEIDDSSLSIWDKDLNCAAVNQTFLQTINCTEEQIIGVNMVDLAKGPEASKQIELCREVLRTGKTIEVDKFKPHQKPGNLSFRVKVFKLGEGIGISSKNITDVKESVEELETLLYRLSNDLREPLTSILGTCSFAKNNISEIKDAQYIFGALEQHAKLMDTTLTALTNAATIIKSAKSKKLIDFNKLIDETWKSLTVINDSKDIELHKEISVGEYYSDSTLLSAVFYELLDNSIKYKRNIPHSQIDISVLNENEKIKILISDNGAGISEDKQKEVYKMLARSSDQAKAKGLGLYSVGNIIRKLNGQILVNSAEKNGTTITLYIPNEKLSLAS